MSDHGEGVVGCYPACDVGTVFLHDFLYEYRDLKGVGGEEIIDVISLFCFVFFSIV